MYVCMYVCMYVIIKYQIIVTSLRHIRTGLPNVLCIPKMAIFWYILRGLAVEISEMAR
jgi:hypothetical protein